MQVTPKAKMILERYASLRTERQNWESHWQDVADYMLPRKADITKNRSKGDKRHELIFDGTATHALELLAASLHGMLTNTVSPWFYLKYKNDELNQEDEATEWLEDCTRVLNQAFNRSNFQQEIFELYHDLIAFGTAALFISEDDAITSIFFVFERSISLITPPASLINTIPAAISHKFNSC